MDPIDNMARSFDVAKAVFAGVTPDRWTAQSPCEDWDARGVAAHMIGGVMMLGTCVPGDEFDMATLEGDYLGADPAATFEKAADEAVAAFRADPSVLGRTVKMPFGEMPGGMIVGLFTADGYTHAWDLAKATGQDTDLDPELGEQVLAQVQSFVTADMRTPGFFGPEQPAPASASTADRVAAFLGRTV